MCWTTEGPQAREPSMCMQGQSYGERLAKEAFWSPATRGSNKDSDGAITPAVEAVHVPSHLMPPGSLQAKQLCHLHAQVPLGQSCHRQKRKKKSCIYGHRVTLVMSESLWPCKLWPAKLLCQGEGFSRQEYWSVLANTGCLTLLEHYIFCCPSQQLPWVLVLPEPLEPKQLHHLHSWLSQGQIQVLQDSLKSKPQWTTYMQRWKQNHNWNPGAVWLRKKTSNLPTSWTSWRLNLHDQLSRLCVYGICKSPLRAPTKENALALIAVDIGGKNTEE